MAKDTILILPGDGCGPEVTREAVKVLQAVFSKIDHPVEFEYGLIG